MTRLRANIAVLAILVSSAPAAAEAPAPASDQPSTRHELTQADADAWLDGYVPYALAQADIAGAVVVIVKDGRVLTQRGFGYADLAARRRVDPETTLFRPGSTSKLFTWTAVMQLVEKGKIDLDADVNGYLDFKIPPYEGKPITMRNIMTHTPGFEEALKHLIVLEGSVPPLGETLKNRLPRRVFAPGTTPAYSNYATGVAGYIVERVSGLPFDEYIERNIFEPLGMTHATFRQPLPAQLAPFMAKGYRVASAEPEPFEVVTVPPAGASAVSGGDMAKFMIAHLNQGSGLMKPETATLMHTPGNTTVPGTNRMALGFYEQRLNGLEAIAHGGDTLDFHSYLWLLPGQNVGLFISMNSASKGRATYDIRLALFQQFGDRYFPMASANARPEEQATAREHAKLLVGSYTSSRGGFSTFLDAGNFLGQTKVGIDKTGGPLIPSLPNLGGAARHWIETAPFVWRDADGQERISAKVENGRIVRWAVDEDSPFTVFERAPWYRDASWLFPLFVCSVAIVLLTALSWPIGAISRRRCRVVIALEGEDLTSYRWVRGLAWLTVAALGGWLLVLVPRRILLGGIDALIWLLQIGGSIGYFGLLGAALWNVQRAWIGPRGWFARAWSALLVLAAVAILWVTLAFHLVSFGTRY
jgi:CubicO group peptidase (beta-lactamase class C family)